MTPSDSRKPSPQDPGATANPADLLPARTTPTWEIEILLSGASVFGLFQVYQLLQGALLDLLQRLSPEDASLWAMLGSYVQAGALALALGFMIHLLMRAFWASAVGLQSIDPTGSLARTETVGPAQRAMLAARLATTPQRIAELDDIATLVFAVSLGLLKIMVGLVTMVLVGTGLGYLASALSGGRVEPQHVLFTIFGLLMTPLMIATIVDGQCGKTRRDAPAWVMRVLRAYAAIGMTIEHNIALQMMNHRMSSGRRSMKGSVAMMLLMIVLMGIVGIATLLPQVGIGTFLKGEFPRIEAGRAESLRGVHYLDRMARGDALRVPVLPSELVSGPYARLFIPYVADWHDATMRGCRDGAREVDEARRDAALLACVARALPVTLNGVPVGESWLYAEDRRHDRRGFVVMIDVRALPAGRHELQVAQPRAALDDDEPVVPWRIPFWR